MSRWRADPPEAPGISGGLEVTMSFRFASASGAEDRKMGRPLPSEDLLADIRPGLDQLRMELVAALRERAYPIEVEITSLVVREGSIVFELGLFFHEVAQVIAFFGGLMQGLEYLARIFGPLFEGSLGGFGSGPLHPQPTIILTHPIAAPLMAPPVPLWRRDPTLLYLLISNGAMIVLLAVLLLRTTWP